MRDNRSGREPPPAPRRRWNRGDWLLLIAAVALGTAALVQQRRCMECDGICPAPQARVNVNILSEKTLRPMVVTDPAQLRWRDVADVLYSEEFRGSFNYDAAAVTVAYEPRGPTLAGTLSARSLKPWFVYQLKLVGAEPIRGVREADNDDVQSWSSWRLGRLGRWWCEDCGWNVSDDDLVAHLKKDHHIKGYVLFDWFMTDGSGEVEHEFRLDSSLHVLWKMGQRDRGEHDSAPRWYTVERGVYGYAPDERTGTEEVGVYGEQEPGRAPIGRLVLPPGEYRVRLNLTEETWHANMSERELEWGGFWAWVMDADLRFTVSGDVAQISRASCPGCVPGPHCGAGLLWFREKR
ncbi:MAG: hypothetical protein J7M38_14790 [Armatimonadetes bacterium]|nr:hypothetical protein [Armatimonadota bacterium]